MGLNEGDLERVPEQMSPRECYGRIYDWHKTYGKRRVEEKYGRDDDYQNSYLDLVDALPPPQVASQEDMDFVFGEVISMLMEWSYHEADDHGIKMAAYAHFALDKRYRRGFADELFARSREASGLSLAWVSNLLIVPGPDRLVVLPANQLVARRIMTPTRVILPCAPYVIVPEIRQPWRRQVEEFEELLNNPASPEANFQTFFEQHPHFLTGVDYESVLPHPVLELAEEESLIPDFFLQPFGSTLADILELKLPTKKVFVKEGKTFAFGAAVTRALRQVGKYRQYFEDERRRKRVVEKYGVTAYKPAGIVIVGRTPEYVTDEEMRQIREDLPRHAKVLTYDDLLRRMKHMARVLSPREPG